MSSTPTIPPLTGTITVDVPVERAFRTFTDAFGSWWPAEYHIGQADMATAILEPRQGGRWYEQGTDGSECDWGRVLAWEPPHRLVVTWQINGQWQYDPDPDARQRDRGPLHRRRTRPDHRRAGTPAPGAARRRPGAARRDHRWRRLDQPPGAVRQGRNQPGLTPTAHTGSGQWGGPVSPGWATIRKQRPGSGEKASA